MKWQGCAGVLLSKRNAMTFHNGGFGIVHHLPANANVDVFGGQFFFVGCPEKLIHPRLTRALQPRFQATGRPYRTFQGHLHVAKAVLQSSNSTTVRGQRPRVDGDRNRFFLAMAKVRKHAGSNSGNAQCSTGRAQSDGIDAGELMTKFPIKGLVFWDPFCMRLPTATVRLNAAFKRMKNGVWMVDNLVALQMQMQVNTELLSAISSGKTMTHATQP